MEFLLAIAKRNIELLEKIICVKDFYNYCNVEIILYFKDRTFYTKIINNKWHTLTLHALMYRILCAHQPNYTQQIIKRIIANNLFYYFLFNPFLSFMADALCKPVLIIDLLVVQV